jgi:hypothetical protein
VVSVVRSFAHVSPCKVKVISDQISGPCLRTQGARVSSAAVDDVGTGVFQDIECTYTEWL